MDNYNLTNTELEVRIQDVKDNPPTLETPARRRFSRRKQGIRYGLLAGLLASIYLFFLNLNYDEVNAGLRFVKYLFIIPPVGIALLTYRKYVPAGRFFKSGLIIGVVMAVTAALFLGVANIVLAAINPDVAFNQFMHGTESVGNTISNSVFLAFEVFVFTMIITFIFLQFLKGHGSTEDGV